MKVPATLTRTGAKQSGEDQDRILNSLDQKLNSKYKQICASQADLDPKEKAKAQWHNRQVFREIAELEKTKKNFENVVDNNIEIMQEFEELKEDILDPDTENLDY